MNQTSESTPAAATTPQSERNSPKREVLDKAIESLVGFDAVVVLASYQDDKGTVYEARYKGNYYAQSGMMRTMLTARERDVVAAHG